MTAVSRRNFLRVLGGGAAGLAATRWPLWDALASPADSQKDCFIFIHASGGWDVTTWSDPRTVQRGLMDPATTATVDTLGLNGDAETVAWLQANGLGNRLWQDTPMLNQQGAVVQGASTFRVLQPPSSNLAFGPGIGRLIRHHDKLCIINGVSMNTVSHQDGTVFSATGRHLAGGKPIQSSIDTVMGNELGRDDLFPVVSVRFPSSYVGSGLAPQVVPLRVGDITTVARSLQRTNTFESAADRTAVTMMLTEEAQDLVERSYDPTVPRGMAMHLSSLLDMQKPQADGSLEDLFNLTRMAQAGTLPAYLTPFFPAGRALDQNAVNFAFGVEAIKRRKARCISLAMGGFDTHANNYEDHCATQQRLFTLVAHMVEALEAVPFEGGTLRDRTHIMVVSEFCRTPMINTSLGRDHYPNNSVLIISPRFKGGFRYGSADQDQLLPEVAPERLGGELRPMTPADVLVTFLSAFSTANPRPYFRDGEVIRAVLKDP